MENLLPSGVPILKHIMVSQLTCISLSVAVTFTITVPIRVVSAILFGYDTGSNIGAFRLRFTLTVTTSLLHKGGCPLSQASIRSY